MEIHDIVRETGSNTVLKKKKFKKAKWPSKEALQIAVKRREVKSKGEKEKYKHLNAEFQRIARGDKKGFLSNQCKEIEENNRIGKTRDLFRKIRDPEGTFHAKMDVPPVHSPSFLRGPAWTRVCVLPLQGMVRSIAEGRRLLGSRGLKGSVRTA